MRDLSVSSDPSFWSVLSDPSVSSVLSVANDWSSRDKSEEWLMRFNISKCKNLKYCTTTSPYEYHMNDEGSCSRLDVSHLISECG